MLQISSDRSESIRNLSALCRNYKLRYLEDINSKLAFCAIEFSRMSYINSQKIISYKIRHTGIEIIKFIEEENINILISKISSEDEITVVSFTGTKDYTFNNIYPNWNCHKTRFGHGSVHTGFLNLYLKYHEEILNSLSNNDKILWTGHSRGGALALLGRIMIGKGVVYSFGSPRLGDPEWLEEHKYIPHWRFTFEGDPIQFLPPRLLRYKHHGRRISLSSTTSFDDICDYSSEKLTNDWLLVRNAIASWSRGRKTGAPHLVEEYSKFLSRFV